MLPLSKKTTSSLSSLRKQRLTRPLRKKNDPREEEFPNRSNFNAATISFFTHPFLLFGLAGSLFFFFTIVTLVPPYQVEPFLYLPFISAVFLIIFFITTLINRHPRRSFLLAYSGALLALFQLKNMLHWYIMMLILPLLFIEVILTKMKKE